MKNKNSFWHPNSSQIPPNISNSFRADRFFCFSTVCCREGSTQAKFKPAVMMSVTVGLEGSLPHESIVETAVGKIIKGLTAILVDHLLFNQNVSCISCSQVA